MRLRSSSALISTFFDKAFAKAAAIPPFLPEIEFASYSVAVFLLSNAP
jgi:hypothetical protein